ncbi:hypothetical protein [Oceanibium sediminis]|uniref:hypothetical protein n=1 Tax=Oceanibium sediminis TaxID=2026339 RepID=UPI000DD39E21|nr:hypothetical protein [Oceanibium sediminis]
MLRPILAALALPLGLAACDMPAESGSTTGGATATTSAQTSASADVAMPAGLTSEERFLWSTLTPAAKAQAVTYIENGGTLTQFMAL